MKENLAINYHLCTRCTMSCRYCFARFCNPQGGTKYGSLEKVDALALTRQMATAMGKVTFVGGEPTLVPWLPELVSAAKEKGATTMLVTNGSLLSPEDVKRLSPSLDWLGLSIDSANPETHRALGRHVRGRPLSPEHYLALAEAAHVEGMGLKVNTVVTALNRDEDMSGFIDALAPRRWKVFKLLVVAGQNKKSTTGLTITDLDFRRFVARHSSQLFPEVSLVAEDNDAMTGSYLMVDPAGRLFDNVNGEYRFSAPILEVGLEGALRQISFSADRFARRGGDYEWHNSEERSAALSS